MIYLKPKGQRAHNNVIKTPDWPIAFQEQAFIAQDPRLKYYYQAGADTGDTPLADVSFVAMDFETTGLDVSKHDIVSIGLVPFDLKRIRCKESRHWIISPSTPLVEQSVVIHGITHSDVNNAPDLTAILEPLLECLAGRIIVVHHRTIERSFLNAALRARINEGIMFPVVDTMDLEARLHRLKPMGFWSRLTGKPPVSIRLADSRRRYGLPDYPPHHALTDALATAELLQAQIAYRFGPDTPLADIWR